MKISMLQCNVRDGDLLENADKLIAMAKSTASDLCVAPLDAICGPMAMPYFTQPDFRSAVHEIFTYIARELDQGPSLLVAISPEGAGPLLLGGSLVAEAPEKFFFRGHRILASCKPVCHAPDVDIIIELAPRPYLPEAQAMCENRLACGAASLGVWELAPNLAGGHGSIIFNGQSVAFAPGGRLHARGLDFAEDVVMVDTDAEYGRIEPACESMEMAQWRALVTGVADFTHKSGLKKAVLGLSGGMDSALVACIAAEALGAENVTCLLMPSPYSSEGSITDAMELARNLGLGTFTLPIESLMREFADSLSPVLERFPAGNNDLTFENLQARIRGVLLMGAANRGRALVLNTGNKSEAAMGYSTLYGDTVGAVAVIGDLLKTRVYELAGWYNEKQGRQIIPRNIFDKPPSAELRPGQKDTDSLPPYELLDVELERLLKGGDVQEAKSSDEMLGLAGRVFSCQFKRAQCPPPLLVSGAPLEALAAPFAGIFSTRTLHDKK